MNLKIILAGLGGQGVVFTTRLLSQTAVVLNYNVLVSETHGMSQRGGSVVSHIKIGGNLAPLIQRGTADMLIALEANEALKNLPFLRPGGMAFISAEDFNDRFVPDELEKIITQQNFQIFSLPAHPMALELGAVAVANVVLIGFASAHPDFPLDAAVIQQTLTELARRSPEINQRAFQIGREKGLQAFPQQAPTSHLKTSP